MEWIMIIAVLVAPFLGVQCHTWLEDYREKRERMLRVFKTLMATRAASISADHVQALNMIDLEFNDEKHKNITLSWKKYLDHLGNFPKDNENLHSMWLEKKNDLLAKLLEEMGKSLGYEFDEVHIKKGIYSPEAHAIAEDENILLRRGLISILYGDKSLKMDVQSFPFSDEEAKEQKEIRQALKAILDGNNKFPVSVSNKEDR